MNENINDDYIKFAKIYLEKAILNKLKTITNNENLTFESKIINSLGEPINVADEISKYIKVIGNDLIKEFSKLENKIDDLFFDYKANENYYKNIDSEKNIDKKEELIKIKEELNQVEEKVIDKIEASNLDEKSKKSFISAIKSIFDDFKNKINKFLGTFKENVKENNSNLDKTQSNNIVIDNEMKIELLKLDTISPKILDKLSKDDDISTLRKIANHPNTSAETLTYIFNKTEDFKVMENLLNNNKTPEYVVNNLSKNEDRDIMLMALKHNNISLDILEKLSKTEDTEVINSILENTNISEKVLQNIVAYNIENKEILNTVINHTCCSENLNVFINEKLEESNQPKKQSLKDKIKQKKDILNKNNQEKSINKENKKEQNQNKSL